MLTEVISGAVRTKKWGALRWLSGVSASCGMWFLVTTHAYAAGVAEQMGTAMGNAVARRIIAGFAPLVDLVQGLAYPVCLLAITAGCMVIMVGNRTKGLQMIKLAAMGFLLLQFVPGIMEILVDVGGSLQQASAVTGP